MHDSLGVASVPVDRVARWPILLAALIVVGCSRTANLPISKPQQAIAALAAQSGATNIKATGLADGGMTLGGALSGYQFAIAVPKSWNGEALVFAHGYSAPGSAVAVSRNPIASPTADPSGGLLRLAYAQGYAVGHSAYQKAGIGVESGAENTLRLKAFLDRIGAKRVYLSGGSMGGSIVMALIDQHPGAFAGALSECGVTDNWVDEIGALIDMRAAYNYFTAGTEYALPGSRDLEVSALSPTPPAIFGFAKTPFVALQMKRLANPVLKLFKDARADPSGHAAQIVARISSVSGFSAEPASFLYPLVTIALGMDDMRATFGGDIYDNRTKTYRSALLSGAENNALNHDIQRTAAATPAAVAFADRWHATHGVFSTPLVAIHNRIDSLVPYAQAAGLRDKVAAAGNQAHLVLLTVPPMTKPIPLTSLSGYAHCGFSPAQLDYAWHTLTEWVQTGRKPIGEAY